MKRIFYLFVLMFLLVSCERYDEDVVIITGIYEANILGVSGPHSISVAYDEGDDILIDAPFDGVVWTTIIADVDNQDKFIKDIDIPDQEIGPGVYIYGDGFFNEGVLQLDYTIDFGGLEIYDFRMVAQQF